MLQKHMFNIRYGLFCFAATLITFGTMALFGIKIAGANSPVGALMACPRATLTAGVLILAVLLSPPRWLDYSTTDQTP